MHFRTVSLTFVTTFALLTAFARADFSGQTILGPLGPGGVGNGNTAVGSNDDNDGFTSGDHIFFIWNGPDDVWQINWPGGDLSVTMTSASDLDLFLYTPGSYNDSGNYSAGGTGNENVLESSAAAGIYYVVVDSEETGAPYSLSVSDVPEPSTLAAAAAGLALFRRRRNK